jgi:ABC-type nitrate/sulfonate/bicarbonate transport system substrate-binding protein
MGERPWSRRSRLLVVFSLAVCIAGAAAVAVAIAAPDRVASTPTVRLALDWTPNTNHTGFFVAQALGYYKKAGINFKVVPYSNTATDTLVGSGRAECGINFEDFMSIARVAGTKETSVMAILQHDPLAFMVLANSKFKRPRDLDGATYGATGLPGEKEITSAVIKHDGGQGNIKFVTLDTASYDAVYSGKVDFASGFLTWEVIDAKLRGINVRTFPLRKYGIPDYYEVVLACSNKWLAANPSVAKRFLAATVKGWQYTNAHPKKASALLIKANKGVFSNPQLVYQSTATQVKGHYLVDAKKRVGCQTLAKWTAYPRFLLKAGAYADSSGHTVTTLPPMKQFFTNKYLPYKC